MSHPPIPPNSVNFVIIKGEACFVLLTRDTFARPIARIPIDYFGNDFPMRFQAACIARCEWIDRAETLANEFGIPICSTCLDLEPQVKCEIHKKEIQPCLDNAEAWRQWGAQK